MCTTQWRWYKCVWWLRWWRWGKRKIKLTASPVNQLLPKFIDKISAFQPSSSPPDCWLMMMLTLREKKNMNETFTISYSPWKTWKQQKPSWTLHDLIIDQTSCDSEIVAWGQKADILPFIRSFLTEFVCCTYIMDHACRDSCMRGSRRCSKGSARVPLIQSCQYFVHPWSWWFDVDDDESDYDDDGEWW